MFGYSENIMCDCFFGIEYFLLYMYLCVQCYKNKFRITSSLVTMVINFQNLEIVLNGPVILFKDIDLLMFM